MAGKRRGLLAKLMINDCNRGMWVKKDVDTKTKKQLVSKKIQDQKQKPWNQIAR